eukprot:1945576-Rhodomonas_salina.13
MKRNCAQERSGALEGISRLPFYRGDVKVNIQTEAQRRLVQLFVAVGCRLSSGACSTEFERRTDAPRLIAAIPGVRESPFSPPQALGVGLASGLGVLCPALTIH